MGMHLGLIAVKASVEPLRTAFTLAWPQCEVVAMVDDLPDARAMAAWKEAHEKSAGFEGDKAVPAREVVRFWQDGQWAVTEDPSYLRAGDERGLAVLSERLGQVLSFVVETAGGCAYFWCFEGGTLRRKIVYEDGRSTTHGTPLPEEAGIDIGHFYMQESEELWAAFGLSPLDEIPTNVQCQAICAIDPSNVLPMHLVKLRPKRPWWKFW